MASHQEVAMRYLSILGLMMLAGGAAAQDATPESLALRCADIADDAQRLACYDLVFRRDALPPDESTDLPAPSGDSIPSD